MEGVPRFLSRFRHQSVYAIKVGAKENLEISVIESHSVRLNFDFPITRGQTKRLIELGLYPLVRDTEMGKQVWCQA